LIAKLTDNDHFIQLNQIYAWCSDSQDL